MIGGVLDRDLSRVGLVSGARTRAPHAACSARGVLRSETESRTAVIWRGESLAQTPRLYLHHVYIRA